MARAQRTPANRCRRRTVACYLRATCVTCGGPQCHRAHLYVRQRRWSACGTAVAGPPTRSRADRNPCSVGRSVAESAVKSDQISVNDINSINSTAMGKVTPRDISPLLQRLRAFLLGRELHPTLRFEDLVATRSPPPPNIPDGATHKLSANYYYSRDVRREVMPPDVVASASRAIADADAATTAVEPKKAPTPGKVFYWD